VIVACEQGAWGERAWHAERKGLAEAKEGAVIAGFDKELLQREACGGVLRGGGDPIDVAFGCVIRGGKTLYKALVYLTPSPRFIVIEAPSYPIALAHRQQLLKFYRHSGRGKRERTEGESEAWAAHLYPKGDPLILLERAHLSQAHLVTKTSSALCV
jgi:hypothetical protein